MFDLCVEYNSCSVMIIRLGNSQAHWNDDSTSRMEPLFAGRTSFLLQSRCVGGLTPATRANRDKQWEWTWCVAHQLGKNKYIHILYIYTYIYMCVLYIYMYIYIIYTYIIYIYIYIYNTHIYIYYIHAGGSSIQVDQSLD